jgi:hypothetical protein
MKRGKQQPSDGGVDARQADDAVDRCRGVYQNGSTPVSNKKDGSNEAEQICGADPGRQSCNHGVQHDSGGFAETPGAQQTGRWLLWVRPPFGARPPEAGSGPSVYSSQCDSTRPRPTRSHNRDASKRRDPPGRWPYASHPTIAVSSQREYLCASPIWRFFGRGRMGVVADGSAAPASHRGGAASDVFRAW